MRKFDISPDVYDDMNEIWQYIAERGSPDSADRLINDIISRLKVIEQSPLIGSQREDLEPNARSIAVGNYVVYFRVTNETTEIARVIHSAHNVQTL